MKQAEFSSLFDLLIHVTVSQYHPYEYKTVLKSAIVQSIWQHDGTPSISLLGSHPTVEPKR